MPASETSPSADTILRNGRIATVSPDLGICEAVSLRDGRFLSVGTDAAVMVDAGLGTQIIDLGGRLVVPGLIDSHLHMHWCAMSADHVQLLPARSIADVQRAVKEATAGKPAGEWILSSACWHESLLAEGRMPTRAELDEAAPDHPVFLPRGGHIAAVNSGALARAGIDADTPNPPGGLVVKDADGRPTGLLLDAASMLVRRVLPPPPSVERQVELVGAMMASLHGLGIVGVTEPGLDAEKIGFYQALRASGKLTMRTDLLYRANNLADTRRALEFAGFRNDEMLSFSGVKFMLDGGIEGARLGKPYRIVEGEQHDPDYRGLLMLPPGGEQELVECLAEIAAAGLQVQCHAVGDVAIDIVANAYRSVAEITPIDRLRWAIMHMHLPGAEAIRTLREIGGIVTAQDHSVLLGHNMRRWWGEERAAFAAPIRTLIDAGLLVGAGTDAPVVPVDPFLCMWWMVTRKTLNGDVLGGAEAISVAEALELYTINNARVLGVEQDRGSIQPGKLADLAVLSKDILVGPADDIRDTRALLTMVGGRTVHRDGI